MTRKNPWLPLLALVCCPAVMAETDLHVRPDPADRPTEVSVGLYVIDLTDVRHANQSMEIDFALVVKWHDPRMAVAGGTSRVLKTTDVWFPNPVIANERRLLTRKLPDVIAAAPDGTLLYRQRFVGELSAPADLRDFPLDTQHFAVNVVFPYVEDEVSLTRNDDRTGRAPALTVAGWKVDQGDVVLGSYRYPADGRELPMFSYRLEGTREIGYYVWKVLLPLLLIVCMSWAAFWMDREQFGPRLGVATTSMLTLIAYWFVLGSLLPRLSYLTRLDHFLIGSTFLVFLALVQTVTMSYLQRTGREARARGLDRLARIVFPGVYVLVVITAFAL